MCLRFLEAIPAHYSRCLSFQSQLRQRQERATDGLAETQRPCAEAAEVQKSRYGPKVESRQVRREDIVLVQDFDKNLDPELLTSWG